MQWGVGFGLQLFGTWKQPRAVSIPVEKQIVHLLTCKAPAHNDPYSHPIKPTHLTSCSHHPIPRDPLHPRGMLCSLEMLLVWQQDQQVQAAQAKAYKG